MTERARHRRDDETAADRQEAPVRVHESRPGRVVFTEPGNTDAWIATDLTVDPQP